MNPQPDFSFTGSGGPVSASALRRFVEQVPHASLKWLLTRLERRVLALDEFDVSNATGTVHLRGLVAVLGRRLVMEPSLECAVVPGQVEVYLTADATPHALDPAIPEGLQVQQVRGQLTTALGPAGLLVARVRWGTDDRGRPTATPDRDWWPAVTRVADHPHSVEAAEQLRDLLMADGPAIAYLLEAAVGGEDVSWPAVLCHVIAICERRFRDRPDRLAALHALSPGDAAAAAAELIRLLREDRSGLLPTTLDVAGRRLTLAAVLSEVRPLQQFEGDSTTIAFNCRPPQTSGVLALALGGPSGKPYRIEVTTGGVSHQAIRLASAPPEAVVEVVAGAGVSVTIRSDDSTCPTAVAVGLYCNPANRP